MLFEFDIKQENRNSKQIERNQEVFQEGKAGADDEGRDAENSLELFHHIIQNLDWFSITKEEIEAISAKDADQKSQSIHITL